MIVVDLQQYTAFLSLRKQTMAEKPKTDVRENGLKYRIVKS